MGKPKTKKLNKAFEAVDTTLGIDLEENKKFITDMPTRSILWFLIKKYQVEILITIVIIQFAYILLTIIH